MMNKWNLYSRRMLAMSLSAAVIFTSMDMNVFASEEQNETVTDWVNEQGGEIGIEENENVDAAGSLDETENADASEELDEAGSVDTVDMSEDLDEANSVDTADMSEDLDEADSADTVDKSDIPKEPDTEEKADDSVFTVDKNGTGKDNCTAALAAASEKLLKEDKVNNITWKYYDSGKLVIEGTGDYIGEGSANPPWLTMSGSITSAVVKITGITSTRNMFYNCQYLETVDLSGLDTSKVTDMGGMFAVGGDKHSFDSADSIIVGGRLVSLDLTAFNTSNVTNMDHMFSHCGALRKLDISGWDTGKVTDMSGMFEFCPELELTGQNLENIDTSNVRNMGDMFKYYAYMRRLMDPVETLDLSSFNTSRTINMSGMFENCRYIKQLNISSFDTGNVIDMSRMFYDCRNIAQFDTSGFDTSNVRDMSYMFYRCRVGSVSNFDTANVTDMNHMFCSSSIPAALGGSIDVSNFDTSNVTDMSEMFRGCDTLKNLDLSNFNTSKVTDVSNMFSGCGSLEDLDISGFDTINMDKAGGMFDGCTALKSLDLSSFDIKSINNFPDISGLSGLTYICTPRNCNVNVPLPEGKWYREDGTECSSLPTGLSYSVALYKNGYPEDGVGETKQVLFISGITVNNKVYDGEAFSYNGTMKIVDSQGNEVSGIPLPQAYYSGSLADGSVYEKSIQAPSNTGSYTLSFEMSGIDENRYVMRKTSYNFRINKRTVTITAEPVEVPIGGTVPEPNVLTYIVNGLLGTDTLAVEPSLKYSKLPESISVNEAGSYDIIPYGAELKEEDRCNYSIKYIRGKLKVGEPEEEEEIITGGKILDITWKVNSAGKLTLEGKGEYTKTIANEVITLPWTADNVRNKIVSAEVKISGIKNAQCMFYDCANLKSVDLSGLDTSEIIRAFYMFKGCKSLESLDVSGFDAGNIKTMNGMFAGCSNLKNINLSGFNTSGAVRMDGMFADCSSLESLDLSGFDTAKAERMGIFNASDDKGSIYKDWGGMFSGCVKLKSLDLGSFNTFNVKNMEFMFYNCKSLESLNLDSFNTENTDNMEYMFAGCSSLTGLNLRNFDMGSVAADTDISNMFNDCSSLSYILTPKNCNKSVNLPAAESTDKWTDENKTLYTQLPQGTGKSIVLYKNAYLEDESGELKKIVFITGISLTNKVYDKKAASYTGTAAAEDSEGTEVKGLSFTYTYEGKLADNTPYPETADAPVYAGSYALYVKITGNDADKYILNENVFHFSINKREITVTAPSQKIEVGGEIPELTKLTCTVNGLLEEDKQTEIEEALSAAPLKYNVGKNEIDTSKDGKYYIVPYGVDSVLQDGLANNYKIKYKMGTLYIGDTEDSAGTIDLQSQELKAAIANIKAKLYDGYAYEPALKVTIVENRKKKVLTEGMDYRIEYENNTNAGTGTVIVKGCGDYKGKLTKDFTIKPKPVTKLKYIIGSMSVGDDTDKLPIYVYDGPKLLTEGVDYAFAGTQNITAKASKGVAITVNGIAGANYTGVKRIKIAVYDSGASKIIKPADIYWKTDDTSMISLLSDAYSKEYTGKAIKPEVVIKTGGAALRKNKDYKVQYRNNKNAGTAYVVVTGKGEYKGKVAATFNITQLNLSDEGLSVDIKPIADKVYNAKLQKPPVKIKAGGRTLVKGRDYTLSYSGNLYASTQDGQAEVIVKGKGNYCGTLSRTFVIKPQNIKKVSVKGTFEGTGDKQLTLMYAKRKLKEGYDYAIEEGARNKNKITITIKAKEGGNFTGSITKKVKIK